MSLAALAACSSGETPNGSATLTVDQAQSEPGSFATIQAAIDAAKDGATVVVKPGIYSGVGNASLDFRGKAIAVRSEDPKDPSCRKDTVIDATGQHVVARFQMDEGPRTTLQGFTVIGDKENPTEAARGVPGFYALSERARPTITDIEVASQSQAPIGTPDATDGSDEIRFAIVSAGSTLWPGTNPFNQPNRTTRYLGSGDVDLDGDVDTLDVSLTNDMILGARPALAMADANGDGKITTTDAAAIQAAVSGTPLPGWWDRLSTRAARESWVDRVAALDPTNLRPYTNQWFVCLQFAVQFQFRNLGFAGDSSETPFDIGRTLYNLPVYHASITAQNFGHSINAVLVGDDPQRFEDWRFIEPQNDEVVTPGMWDMPLGSQVNLTSVSTLPVFSGFGTPIWVGFTVDATGGHLASVTPGLLTARPAPSAGALDNDVSYFNPRALPGGKLLYETQRQDLDRNTDLFIGNTSAIGSPSGQPLVGLKRDVHLLDAITDASGVTHLLWKSSEPGVYYGQLAAGQTALQRQELLFPSDQDTPAGRFVLTAAGKLYAFWYLRRSNTTSVHQSGVYWSSFTGGVWSSATAVVESTEGSELTLSSPGDALSERDPARQFFDVAERNGALELAYLAQGPSTRQALRMRYTTSWSAAEQIATGNLQGVRLAADTKQNLHMVYWLGAETQLRGSVWHRLYNGSTWASPVQLDSSGAAAPALLALPNGSVYLSWERQLSDRVVPILRAYNGTWQSEQVLSSSSTADAWYPTPTFDKGANKLVVAWSERSGYAARLALAEIPLACTPSCTNRQCGDNGCGGSCGTCSAGITCNANGQCQAPAPTCSDGIKNQGETGIDCGGPCPACQSTGCTCPAGCSAVVNAAVPFTRDGAGASCYFFKQIGGHINSWNTTTVNLNGNDITNRYLGSSSYPAPVGGGYYLYYKGPYAWSHVEVLN